MTADPPPRRKLHLMRWIVVLFIAGSAWSGWRVVALRSALKEARALGWTVEYIDPAEEFRGDWKAAFRKETSKEGVRFVQIPDGDGFASNSSILYLLNPSALRIEKAGRFRSDGATAQRCVGMENRRLKIAQARMGAATFLSPTAWLREGLWNGELVIVDGPETPVTRRDRGCCRRQECRRSDGRRRSGVWEWKTGD